MLISVVLIGFLAYQADFGTLWSALRNAKPGFVLLAVCALLSTQVFRAWRWQHLLYSIQHVPLGTLTSATIIGSMTDMILPARGGDVVRACVVGRREGISRMSALATIVVERLFDVLTILTMAIPILLLVAFPKEMDTVLSGLRIAVGLGTLLCLIAAGSILMLVLGGERVRRVVDWILGRVPARFRARSSDWIDSFLSGLQTVRTGHRFLVLFAQSLILWLAFAASNYFILQSFGLQLPWYASFLLLVFQVLGVTIPSSPGFIGTYHAAVVAALALFGIPGDLAITVGITMHAAFFIPYIVAGLLCLWKEDLSFSGLRELGNRS